MNGIWPRLSPSGRHVAAGNQTIWIDRVNTGFPGTTPVWLDDNTIFYTRQPDGALMRYRFGAGAPEVVLPVGPNPPVAFLPGGVWVGCRMDPPRLLFGSGSEVHGLTWPSSSDGGKHLACLRHADSALILQKTGAVVDPSHVVWHRWGSQTLTWERAGGHMFGRTTPDQPNISLGRGYKPVPVWTGRELLVLFHDAEGRIFLADWFSLASQDPHGYILGASGGSAYSHDARPLDATRVRVVWTRADGSLEDRVVDLTSPRTRLSVPAKPPVDPPTPPPADPPTDPKEPDPLPLQDAINLNEVTFLHADLRQFKITSEIKSVRFTSSQVCIEHTKAGKWPVRDDDGVAIEGNPWVFARVNGRWYAATYEWLRPGQTCKGITADNIGGHIKKDPLRNWRPQPGELVGFCVSTFARDSRRTTNERSNVVLARWGEGIVSDENPPVNPPVNEPDPPITKPEPPSAACRFQPVVPDLSPILASIEALVREVVELRSELRMVAARQETLHDDTRKWIDERLNRLPQPKGCKLPW